MKKVNIIIRALQDSYSKLSSDFHEYFNSRFERALVSNIRFSNEAYRQYNHTNFDKFIDKCVNYRLGISDVLPKEGDIIYDLSNSLNPETFEDSVAEIFGELVYCAYPPKLVSNLRSQLEVHKLDDDVVDLIMSKLEFDQK